MSSEQRVATSVIWAGADSYQEPGTGTDTGPVYISSGGDTSRRYSSWVNLFPVLMMELSPVSKSEKILLLTTQLVQ